MKHLSIKKTTDAYPNLTPFDRERLRAFENQSYFSVGNVLSIKELAEIAKQINNKKK